MKKLKIKSIWYREVQTATYSVNSEIRVATKAYTNTGKDWIAIFKEDVDYTVREASVCDSLVTYYNKCWNNYNKSTFCSRKV